MSEENTREARDNVKEKLKWDEVINQFPSFEHLRVGGEVCRFHQTMLKYIGSVCVFTNTVIDILYYTILLEGNMKYRGIHIQSLYEVLKLVQWFTFQ